MARAVFLSLEVVLNAPPDLAAVVPYRHGGLPGGSMIKVTYFDVLQGAPVVTFHEVQFEHRQPVEVADDWSGLELARRHPHFKIEPLAAKPKDVFHEKDLEPLRVPRGSAEARAFGREAFASGYRRAAPTGLARALKRAWDEGYDRARRQARKVKP